MRWDSSGVRVAGRRAVRLDPLAPRACAERGPNPCFPRPEMAWPLPRFPGPPKIRKAARGRRAVAGNSVCILLPLAGICLTGVAVCSGSCCLLLLFGLFLSFRTPRRPVIGRGGVPNHLAEATQLQQH